MIGDRVRQHYRERWGEPSVVFNFEDAEDGTVDVWKWGVESTNEGVGIYATVGASLWPTNSGRPLHRTEYFMPMLPPMDGAAELLAKLALYARQRGVEIDHGHTVASIGPLWPGVVMERVLILRQSGSVISPLLLSDGVHVEFLETIPIYESEREFKTQYGVEALLQRWRENDVPYWTITRSPDP